LAVDVAIVGAGAAGLATGIFLRRLNPGVRVVVLDGARRPGAKILVSGGSRCNVTNAIVTERDFQGGSRPVIRRVLRALPVPETVAFFEEIGVRLHEEPGGKLFPDSNRSRDVLEALLRELERTGAALHSGRRVLGVERTAEGFRLDTAGPPLHASFVVLATGGQSLPKTGSDGAGYEMARALGHAIVPTTPALVPLTLDPAAEGGIHQALSGVSHDVTLAIWIDGAVALRLDGALLWTHFGISGPVVLDASRHWLRARLEGRPVQITASFVPGGDFDAVDRRWTAIADERPRATIQTVLATLVPASVASAVLAHLELAPDRIGARLGRDDRRRLARALTAWPLPVSGSRGYNYAEATAGGVDLREVDPSTLESRRCPGLFLVGEILDVDGRIGGFNFQWAWSSGRVAGAALARRT
jgi:predicted Rossmann fold flavoprotein